MEIARSEFDKAYDKFILDGGFFETGDYYVNDKERYWRSLQFFHRLGTAHPSRVLEIGGGQMAVLCKLLFKDECTVGDVSTEFFSPLKRLNIDCIQCNLMDDHYSEARNQFDVIFLLEVIEHLPVPPYVIFERLKAFLKPGGVLFLTTPNLFRLRNVIRMALGREFLDRFMLPQPGRGLGHQLEYSAEHMSWHVGQAGFGLVSLDHDDLGRVGHSPSAKLARKLLAPLSVRHRLRDGLVVSARVP